MSSEAAERKTADPIHVVIVDDDPFVRDSLTTILTAAEDLEVCGTAGDGEEALGVYESAKPDILLMDIQMPQMTGIEAAEQILQRDPEAKIVFLTTFSDDEYIASALKLGSKGYLIKQDVATIAPALRSVMAGQVVLGEEVLGRIDLFVHPSTQADAASRGVAYDSGASNRAACEAPIEPPATDRDILSVREQQIAELVAQGIDNRGIAGELYISEGTVRNHVSTILQKLDLRNRTQLASYVLKKQRP